MSSLKIISVLLFASCVFAAPYFKECPNPAEYNACRKASLQGFFKDFSSGDNDKDIKPMDPMILGEVDVPEESLDIMFHYKNFKVTGLKDVVVTEFSKHKDENVAHFSLKFDYVADGPLDVEFLKKDKILSGSVHYEAGVTATVSYPFSKIENGKYAPKTGKETVTCESTHVTSTINDELRNSLEHDPVGSAVKDEYTKIHHEHQAKVVCATAKAIFKVILENIYTLVHIDE
ncbi:juvenile hormone-binding protein-like [Amyelois transitella]|uniref:juvenile hormone-binding protein-like n=1 Tax=Amyelois transitella TaxID=680683 RepID=UPI00067BDFBE|nr:juvenile hormone-binding protein-like [Amyelois transitella]